MAWSESRVFTQFLYNPGLNTLRKGETAPTGYTDLATDTIRAALFDSSITPDRDAAVGSTGYNTGQWLTSDEVTHANWPAKGRQLTPVAGTATQNDGITVGTSFISFDAADTAGAGTLTLSDVNGCLVLDDSISAGTVADQGICYNWFGGAQSVTSGTFTIVWHANGIFRITT